jgi:hypothetical protein
MNYHDKIYQKYYQKASIDIQEFFANHSRKENDLADKGFKEAMNDLRQAIQEARTDTARQIFEELEKHDLMVGYLDDERNMQLDLNWYKAFKKKWLDGQR